MAEIIPNLQHRMWCPHDDSTKFRVTFAAFGTSFYRLFDQIQYCELAYRNALTRIQYLLSQIFAIEEGNEWNCSTYISTAAIADQLLNYCDMRLT